MTRRVLFTALLVLAFSTPALAGTRNVGPSPAPAQTYQEMVLVDPVTGAATTVTVTGSVTDAANAAYGTASAMTVGTTYAAGRAVAAACTVAGNAVLTLTSGSITVPLAAGLTILPFASTAVASQTATCTYTRLS